MSNQITTITQDIYALRDNFNVMAPAGMNFEKEAGFAIQLLSANEYALKVAMGNRDAVRNAITNVAAIGISLNPAKKQAYLVPRKVKGNLVICLDISYIGLIDLAVATGSILWAQANVVREKDHFVLNGYDKPPTHHHDPFAGAEARGEIRGAYVVVKTCDGEYLTHTMDIDAIYSIRDRSEAWKSYMEKKNKGEYAQPGPWGTDEGEMIKKTVVKQAYKYWPKTDRSIRLDEAIQLLNTEGGEGLPPLQPGPKACPVNVLDDWIKKAQSAQTEAGLADVWQRGLTEIKPFGDLDAYNKFKAEVASRGAQIKKPADVTDLTPKDVPTRASVIAAMEAATSQDALDLAADMGKNLPEEEDRKAVAARYDELAAAFAS